MNIDFGIEGSSIVIIPPLFNVRYISYKPFSRFSKFLIPNPAVIASNDFSGNGNFSESAIFKEMIFSSFFSFIFF